MLTYVLILSITHCKCMVTETYKVIHNYWINKTNSQKLYIHTLRTNTPFEHIHIVKPSLNFHINSFWKLKLGVCMGRVEGIFWPNPPWWVKKNLTQPNPSHKSNPTQPNPHESGWVRLNLWVWQIFFIIIIILSRKKYKY